MLLQPLLRRGLGCCRPGTSTCCLCKVCRGSAAKPLHRHEVQHHVQVRMRKVGDKLKYFEEHPDKAYGEDLIVSSQPDMLKETRSGLDSTKWWLQDISPNGPAIKLTVELHCDLTQTPWCV